MRIAQGLVDQPEDSCTHQLVPESGRGDWTVLGRSEVKRSHSLMGFLRGKGR